MTVNAPTVRARAGAVSAVATVHRPSWSDMVKSYPSESVKAAVFYPMVSKWYASKALNADPVIAAQYENTCSARMSYALNRSGLRLPAAPDHGSIKGDDGYNYWLRVSQLSKKLKDQFGAPDKEFVHKRLSGIPAQKTVKARIDDTRTFIRQISTRKGIVVFEVSGWSNASGHFTLWDGKDLKYVGEGQHNDPTTYEYYFWLMRMNARNEVAVQTTRIIFWELK